MGKEKDELLNFAFNEQDDKLKFYREILIKMLDHTYFGEWNEDRIKDSVEKADKLARELIKKCDEYEVENTRNFILDTDRIKHYVSTTTNENFRTIVDNGPQYQVNQKPYGTLGEHWKELVYLFDFKKNHSFYKNALQNFIKKYKTKDFNPFKKDDNSFSYITEHETKCLIDIANSLGIEFIEDFIKACEKCED